MDLSGPHIVILLAVVLLLFGSTRLPGAARALGDSMHIFKKSVKGITEETPPDGTRVTQSTVLPQVAPQPLPAQAAMPDATQQQLLDLQRQVQELKQQNAAAANGGTPAQAPPETQHSTQQPF
jgi:sec-independent protein translocase protein TatA